VKINGIGCDRMVLRLACAASVAVLLPACGGGGGGSVSTPGGPPKITIAISPTAIKLGDSATLTWSATNTNFCEARYAWSGSRQLSGTQTVTPAGPGTFVYKLACTSNTGDGSMPEASATLTVSGGTAYGTKGLVSDTSGAGAATVDMHLTNPWGITAGSGTAMWVARNGDASAAAYDGTGAPYSATPPQVIRLPMSPSGGAFSPTGVVFNGTSGFVISAAGKSAPAQLIFVGESGGIAGWSPSVDANNAISVYSDTAGAVYKAAAIATTSQGTFLLATDFHNDKVDVFDGNFAKQPPSGPVDFAFKNLGLPSGYAPFGILVVNNGPGGTPQVYLSFAQQAAPANTQDSDGAGLGVVDLFDTSGKLLQTIASYDGPLNAPWGMALAPADFGTFSHALLVGNFGDGKINAFDPSNGTFLGTLTDANGAAVTVPGLWGIAFGNDALSQPHNTLFFASGPNNKVNGLYGRIDLTTAP
jgi:uncharacterized protein (TIGR03118 family)